jgi:hypothetical protein
MLMDLALANLMACASRYGRSGEVDRGEMLTAARIVGELHEPSVVPMTDARQGAGFSISSMVDAPESDIDPRANTPRCAHGRLLSEECPECDPGAGTPTEFKVTDEERAALDRALEDRQRELQKPFPYLSPQYSDLPGDDR